MLHGAGGVCAKSRRPHRRAVLATDGGGLPLHLEDEFRWCTSLVKVAQENSLPKDIYRWWRFTIRGAPTRVKDKDGIL